MLSRNIVKLLKINALVTFRVKLGRAMVIIKYIKITYFKANDHNLD